jgi:radical SAM protein with 4Fe4S-binding SPASM domain
MSKKKDLMNLARHVTIKRLFNLFLLYFSFLVSRIIRRPFLMGTPFTVSIEPTTACNLACPECPSGKKEFTRPTGRLSNSTNELILDQLGSSLFYVNYYFQGEPFLNADFLNLIRTAKKRNIYTSTSTNAHFITTSNVDEIVTSGLDRLIISIDGLSQETYSKYRVNGLLSKVLESSKLLVETKKKLNSSTPHLIFQFLVVSHNEHELKELQFLADEIGIDEVRFKSAQLYDYKQGHHLMPKNSDYSRYVQSKNGEYRLKYETGNHCWRMWSSCVFTWDAKVVPCCFDKDAHHQLGSLTTQNFHSIWLSDAYTKFRKQILNGRNEIAICQNCSEGTKVWL